MLMTMVIEEKPQRNQELDAARVVRSTGIRNLMEGGYQIKMTGLNDSDGVYRYDDRKTRNVSINRNYNVAFHGQIEQGRFNGRQKFRNREQQQIEEIKDKNLSEMATVSIKPLTTTVMPRYLCVLYVATGGLQGALLGSDEDEIVLLIYIVIDSYHRSVLSKQQFIVRPSNADINENIVSEQLQSKSSMLSSDLIKSGGKSLEYAIEQFDQYVRHLFQSINTITSDQFAFITDGQLPLRQCLHPETSKKNIPLPSYYNHFIDLHKEVFRFSSQHVDDKNLLSSQSFNFYSSIPELLSLLDMTSESDKEYFIQEATDLVHIVQQLLTKDHKFNRIETINIALEPGICSVNDEVDDNCIVRARGLPWQSSDQDIAKFFRGLNIEKGGVALCLSAQGRRNGEAVIRFTCEEHRDMALKRHRHHMSSRYIEVYRASGDEFLSVAGGASNEAQAFLSRGAQVIIRMRGLPYDCTAKQVLDFFNSGENACSVLDGEDGVLFVKKAHGRATGDAFVLFSNESDAPKALTKHRELIGSRYIELFRSTTAEVQQVLNRSMDPVKYDSPRAQNHQNQQVNHQTHAAAVAAAAVAAATQIPYLPQHVITSGTLKDCIRLRGLPYEAQVEHILDFLGEHAKNIVFQGVHMVYNAQGQPSGEAFIQMNSEQSAFLAATQRHHRFMGQGKKPRYIEVFQCSGEDMNIVLTGGINTAPSSLSPASIKNGPSAVAAAASAAAALLSPGNTIISAPPSQATGIPSSHTNQAQFLTANQANFATFTPISPHQLAAVAATARQFYPIPAPLFYWPYPSPPVSPSGAYYTSGGPLPTHQLSSSANAAAIMDSECLANVSSPQSQSQQLLPNPPSPPVTVQQTPHGNDLTLCPSPLSLSSMAPPPLPPIHITQLPSIPAYTSRVHEHIMIMDELGRANFIQNHSFHLQHHHHHPLNMNTSSNISTNTTGTVATSTTGNSPQQFVELLI